MKTLQITLFSFIICLASYTAHAQRYLTFGPKAGFNVNHFEDLRREDGISYDNFSTVSVGAFGRLNLGMAYVQPEVYFMVKGANYSISDNVSRTGQIRLNTFEAPILLGYHLVKTDPLNVRVFAGPVLNLYTKEGENDLKALDPNRYTFDRSVNSLQFGAGADVLMFTLDARYERGMSRYNTDLGVRPSQFIISVGYKLYEK